MDTQGLLPGQEVCHQEVHFPTFQDDFILSSLVLKLSITHPFLLLVEDLASPFLRLEMGSHQVGLFSSCHQICKLSASVLLLFLSSLLLK